MKTSKKDLHSGELDDDTIFEDEDVKVSSQQECMSKLQGLKSEINQSWCADDRVTCLRLSIKVSFPSKDITSLGFLTAAIVLVMIVL